MTCAASVAIFATVSLSLIGVRVAPEAEIFSIEAPDDNLGATSDAAGAIDGAGWWVCTASTTRGCERIVYDERHNPKASLNRHERPGAHLSSMRLARAERKPSKAAICASRVLPHPVILRGKGARNPGLIRTHRRHKNGCVPPPFLGTETKNPHQADH